MKAARWVDRKAEDRFSFVTFWNADAPRPVSAKTHRIPVAEGRTIDFEDLEAWTRSDAFAEAHADRPPREMFGGPRGDGGPEPLKLSEFSSLERAGAAQAWFLAKK